MVPYPITLFSLANDAAVNNKNKHETTLHIFFMINLPVFIDNVKQKSQYVIKDLTNIGSLLFLFNFYHYFKIRKKL